MPKCKWLKRLAALLPVVFLPQCFFTLQLVYGYYFFAAGGPMLGEKFFCWWTAAGGDEFFGAGALHDLNRRMILRFIEK